MIKKKVSTSAGLISVRIQYLKLGNVTPSPSLQAMLTW
jgi:hypothetical protein